jgi:hypothetical protein
MEWQWNPDAFDAIHITSPSGEFQIIGTDDHQVLLEGTAERRHTHREPVIQGRWLVIQPIHGADEWTLELPKSKAWVIEIASASGEINIENVHAHLDVRLGSGDIQIENCRGTFNVQNGSGDVQLENCVQAETPRVPAFSYQEPVREPGGIPPIPPMPPPGKRIRLGKHITIDDDEEWQKYGREWEEWGERFAEQAGRWAEKFAREFGKGFGWETKPDAPGMHVQLGSGDVQFEQVDAQFVTVHLGNGDVQLEDGRVARLRVETARGDVDMENILPADAWDISTRHGDIHLVLPADTNARIDAATRHGDIESDVPLVGVGRPGRAARHGGRMVGTLGETGENPIEIHLESLHGDIQIDLTGRNSRYAQPPPASRAPKAPVAPAPPVPPTPPMYADQAEAFTPVAVADKPTTDATSDTFDTNAPAYDSQIAILQALQRGEITVAEAELLLRSVK